MKNFKKFTSLMLAIMLAFAMIAVMASCGNDEEPPVSSSSTTGSNGGTDNSTPGSTPDSKPGDNEGGDEIDMSNPNMVKVTVVDQNGKGLSNAKVQICQGEACFASPIITGANGVGSREYKNLDVSTEVLKAKVNSVEEYGQYSYQGYVYFAAGSREITVTIRKVSVNVLDQNGKAVENASVQVYQGEHPFDNLLVTDEDGVASVVTAVGNEELSAVVTGLSEEDKDMYELSKDPVLFGKGVYDGTVTVSKLSTYSVKIATMLGINIENAKVELYNGETNKKQKTGYTDSKGIVRFENIKPTQYYVKVTIESPTYKIITESQDGKYYFADKATNLVLDAVQLDVIKYTVSGPKELAGAFVTVYDKNHLEYVIEEGVVLDENGKATISLPYGEYVVECFSWDIEDDIAPIIFTKDGVIDGEFKILNNAGNEKSNPLYIVSGFYYTFSGNGEVWFAIPFADGKVINISGDTGYVLSVSEGEITTETHSFNAIADENGMMLFSVKPSANEEMSLSFEVSAPGSYGAPFDLNELVGDEIDGKTTNISVSGGQYIYYQYTPSKNGTLTITTSHKNLFITIDGDFLISGEATENGYVISYPVTAGETIVFAAYAMDPETIEPVDINDGTLSFTYGEVKKDYTVEVYVEGELKQDITVILYAVDGEGNKVEVARATTDEQGVATFADVVYAKGYVASVETIENYEITGVAEPSFGAITAASVFMTHVKDGTLDYPYELDYESHSAAISVPQDGNVWFSINIMPGQSVLYTFVVNSANVQFNVYNADALEDGVIDENDIPYGTSQIVDGKATFTFGDNGRAYFINITTIDGNAEELECECVSKDLSEGESTDNPKAIAEAGSISETISAGKTVYYRYEDDDNVKLTITIEGEGVTLKKVELSMDDTTITDAENNTIVIDSTMVTWIYFAVSADADASYTVTVTVE